MRKILFLEDRPERLKIFLPNEEKDMNILRDMEHLDMPESEDCKRAISNINSNQGFNHQEVKEISLMIIHESSLTTSGLSYLNKISKLNKINVILFSGGISQTAYNKEDDYDMLYINSSELYTERFISFLEKYIKDSSTHILEVANPNWRISYWFLLRQLLNTKEVEEKSGEPDYDRIDILENKIENTCKILGIEPSESNPNISIEIGEINKEIKKLLL